MRRLRALLVRFGGSFGRGRRDREFAEEMESHLQLHIDDNLRRGLTPAEARRQALIDLGGVEQTKESYRERRGLPVMENAAQDVRYAVRVLRKNPSFTAVVVLTLALGIGANTAIFSIVNAVLLSPLPYADADRIVQVWHTPPQEAFPGRTEFSVSPANYLDWRDQNHVFERIAAYDGTTFTFTGGDRPEAVTGGRVAPDLFAVLRAKPLLGRTFTPEEDAPGQDKVVVLGHRFWQTRFGSDPGVVGRQIRLGGEVAVRVMTPGYLPAMRIPLVRGRDVRDADAAGQPGVILVSESMARRFWPDQDPIGKRLVLTFYPKFPRQVVGIVGDVKQEGLAALQPSPTIYVPLGQMPRPWMSLVVRTTSQLTALMPAVTGAIREVDPEQPVLDVMTLESLLDDSLAHQRFSMLLLALFAGFALLLAGIGIYSVLSYAVRRRAQEIGIRVALGAQRSDVLWMVLGHGLRLTVAGLVIGTLGAIGLTRLLTGLLFGVPPTDPLTFTVVAALLCAIALLACYLPARRAMRVDPMIAMRYE